MDANAWKRKIKKAAKDAGTYKPFFDSVIDTLAQIMEARDRAHEQYLTTGAHPTIVHVNKAKEKNIAKNPILVMETELNTQALAYWRDLGLTPKGLRALTAESIEQQKGNGGLEKLLEKLGG